ncbi:unnamed protein product [Clonostachys solani]|uniref:Secreted protein n=1 Tax=Clonostachys solani TaxID=160281 RepID=A0A9N9W6V4_9HYPO|nr:unnamed protein product [Clonostachys solani]
MKLSIIALMTTIGLAAAECSEGFWYADRETREPCATPCEVQGGGKCILDCPEENDPNFPLLCAATYTWFAAILKKATVSNFNYFLR